MGIKIGLAAKCYGIRRNVLFHNVSRYAERDPEALSLSDRIADYSLVSAENVSVKVYEIARNRLFSRELFYKAHIVSVRHKANVLTVGLVGVYKSCLFGKCTNLRLIKLSKRKQCVSKLFLRERIKHIGLVFTAVFRAFEKISARFFIILPNCVMSRSYIVVPKLDSAPEHFVKLYISVALYARIRSSAAHIAVCELRHYTLAKAILEIEHNVLESETVRNAPCVHNVRKSTAGPTLLLRLHNILV